MLSLRSIRITAAVAIVLLGLAAGTAFAHCDTMDGPVVLDAQEALKTGSIDKVLTWVQKADEDKIRQSFNRTLEVRKLGPEAKELADVYFFETLVRIHRAGEGAPYTGLKPAGGKESPAIEAADKALESGDPKQLYGLINSTVDKGLQERYREMMEKKEAWKPNDVEAGRRFVAAYVEFIHYADGIYKAASGSAHHQADASAEESHNSAEKHQCPAASHQ